MHGEMAPFFTYLVSLIGLTILIDCQTDLVMHSYTSGSDAVI